MTDAEFLTLIGDILTSSEWFVGGMWHFGWNKVIFNLMGAYYPSAITQKGDTVPAFINQCKHSNDHIFGIF